jgi:hypothetical protein
MSRVAVIVLLTALSAINLYSAYSPDWSRRHFRLPTKSDTLRTVIHAVIGSFFLLGVLLLIYAAINPRG